MREQERGGRGEATRDRIIRAASELFETKGYHATGMAEIVRRSASPRGSVYHHFPGGKEEIAAAAVAFGGERLVERIRLSLAEIAEPAEALETFVSTIAHYVEALGFSAGGPLTIVAAETALQGGLVNESCRRAYARFREAFAAKLLSAGFSAEGAASLAVTIVSAIEGAIILSRTEHSGDSLRLVAADLRALVELRSPGGAGSVS